VLEIKKAITSNIGFHCKVGAGGSPFELPSCAHWRPGGGHRGTLLISLPVNSRGTASSAAGPGQSRANIIYFKFAAEEIEECKITVFMPVLLSMLSSLLYLPASAHYLCRMRRGPKLRYLRREISQEKYWGQPIPQFMP
jgi:hypothetical protein